MKFRSGKYAGLTVEKDIRKDLKK